MHGRVNPKCNSPLCRACIFSGPAPLRGKSECIVADQSNWDLVPFRTKRGTYYADTASPGQIVKQGDEYLMFFSAAAFTDVPKKRLLRTLSIARMKNLDGEWTIDPQPALPPEQQIENSALHFEPAIQRWFLFTNHIGLDEDGEYTESIWVY